MHIVLSGYYGFDNVGDEAILFSIIRALRKWQKDIDITVLSNHPEATKKNYGVQAVNRWKLKEVNQVLKKADGLISGGGSLLQDATGIKTIPYYAGIIKMAKWHKKPVFVYAQGMGPIHHSISKSIVKQTLNKVDMITVRDIASKKLLETIGVKKSIHIVPDPVIGLDHHHFSSDWLKHQKLDSYIAVSVRDWPTAVNYKEKIAESLNLLIQQGEQIVFVPMHGEHDATCSKEIVQMMKNNMVSNLANESESNWAKHIHIAPADLSIEEKIAIIGHSKLLLGMRLHSLIFSSIYYTPFIAISYDPKIDAFADIVQQPIIGHVHVDDWDGQDLFKKSLNVLKNRKFYEEHLQTIVQEIQFQANATAKLALDVFRQSN